MISAPAFTSQTKRGCPAAPLFSLFLPVLASWFPVPALAEVPCPPGDLVKPLDPLFDRWVRTEQPREIDLSQGVHDEEMRERGVNLHGLHPRVILQLLQCAGQRKRRMSQV